jgi:CrcB protein
MMGPIFLVFLGGGAGAVSRFLIAGSVNQRSGGTLPLGTLAVNLAGCLFIGVVAGLGQHLGASWVLLCSDGFIGAFTTFSTLSYETLRLLEEGALVEGFLNPVLSLMVGLFFVILGAGLGGAWR